MDTTLRKNFNDTVMSAGASGNDTVRLIVRTINTYSMSPFVIKTMKLIKAQSPTKMDFLKNLFAVACKNVKYLADTPGHEVVYTPLKLMEMGKGDCKKYTVFIGAILKAAGYDGVPKVVKYDLKKDWEHIYIISREGDKYVILDPVNHCKFNKEVDYAQGRLNYLDGTNSKIMAGNKLSLMGGLGDTSNDLMSGAGDASESLLDHLQTITGVGCKKSKYSREGLLGLYGDYLNGVNDENMIYGDEDSMGYSETEMGKKKGGKPKAKKTKEQKKERRKKFFKKLKKFDPALATIRISFLSLVKLGGALQKMKGLHINLAAHLADAMKDPVKAKPIIDIWEKFGGDTKVLLKAIVQAGKSKMHGTDDTSMLITGEDGNSIGVAPLVAAAAVITAATPLLIPVIKMLKKNKNIPEGQAQALEEGIDTAENLAQRANSGDLTPESITTLVKSKLVRESAREDGGGEPNTVRDMKSDTENFTKGEEAQSSSTSPKGYVDSQKETTDPATRTASEVLNLPTKQDETPQGKNMLGSIKLPTVWCRILLLIMLLNASHILPTIVITTISYVAVSGLIATSINLFINKKTKIQWLRKKA